MDEKTCLSIYIDQIKKYPRLTEEQEKTASIDELIKHGTPLVIHIAKRYTKGYNLDDLVSHGNIGLIKAAKTFNPKKGKFSNHAGYWIQAMIHRYIKAENRNIHNQNIIDCIPDNRDHYEKRIINNIILCDAINKLKNKEKMIILLRFGILDRNPKTLKEVGELLGRTHQAVNQVLSRALFKLKDILNGGLK